MKKLPMLLLLIVPYGILILCSQMNMDFSTGLTVYGAILVFNAVYAFRMPRVGFNGKQLLFWNLLLKLCNIPLVLLILLVTLITSLVGGEGIRGDVPLVIRIELLSCYFLQLSSAMFGISGFLWCHKYGSLSRAGVIFSTIVQLIPCIDVIGSILCYIMFRKEGQKEPFLTKP